MSRTHSSIGTLGTILVIAAFSLGVLATWFWIKSDAKWSAHLMRSDFAGQSLYAALMTGAPTPNGIEIYADRPRDAWPRDETGAILLSTKRLDLSELLALIQSV